MAGKMTNVLAIDLGASSGRGIVFSSNGVDVTYREVHRFDNNCVDVGGHLKWDFDGLMREIITAIKICHDKAIHIDGIGIDTWGVDYGVIDANGNLKAQPYSYRDARTSGAIDREEYYTKREMYNIAGISLNEFNTSYQLISEQKNKGVTDGDTILYMPYLIAYMLTGKMGSDISIASTSAIYGEGGYDEGFLTKVGLTHDNFAKVLPIGEVVGLVKRDILDAIGIDYDIKVIAVAGHDTASAIITVMDEGKSPLYLSSGTWSLFGTLVDKPILSDTAFNENYTNERGFLGKVTLLKNIMGMWIIQECRREWNKSANLSWQDIQDLSNTAEYFKGFINVGDQLFNAPQGMDKRIVDYVKRTQNIEIDGVAEISRCIYNSLALEYRYALEGLEKITNKKYSELYIIGGGTKNSTLNQLVSDSLNIKVIGGCVEATAIGNALAGFYGLGVANSLGEIHALADKCYTKEVYYPSPDRERWDDAYKQYLTLKK